MIHLLFGDFKLQRPSFVARLRANLLEGVNYDNVALTKRSISDLAFWAWCLKSLKIYGAINTTLSRIGLVQVISTSVLRSGAWIPLL